MLLEGDRQRAHKPGEKKAGSGTGEDCLAGEGLIRSQSDLAQVKQQRPLGRRETQRLKEMVHCWAGARHLTRLQQPYYLGG